MAEDSHGRGGLAVLPPLIDPRVGALARIFEECAPADAPLLIGRNIGQVYATARDLCHPGWVKKQDSTRELRLAPCKTLRQNGREHDGDLLMRAYAYIEQHY